MKRKNSYHLEDEINLGASSGAEKRDYLITLKGNLRETD